jgi:ligand-binding sensor domain-containing protein
MIYNKLNRNSTPVSKAGKFDLMRAGGMILLCLLFGSSPALAQYQVVKVAIDGKRCPQPVYQLGEDSHGFIWYLNQDGLYRYDGQNSVNLKQDLLKLGFKGAPENMFLDSKDRLWIAAKGCVAWLDLKNWKLHKAPEDLLHTARANHIVNIVELSNGKVMFVYASGYIILGEGSTFTKFVAVYYLAAVPALNLSLKNITYWNKAYWTGTPNGELISINAVTGTSKTFAVKKGLSILGIIPFKDRLICRAVDGNIYSFDGEQAKRVTKGDPAPQPKTHLSQDSIYRSGDRYLYLNRNGLNKREFSLFSGKVMKREMLFTDTEELLSELDINGFIYNKKNGALILGTSNGIYTIVRSNTAIPQLNPLKKLSNSSVRGIYRFPDGDVFYAGYQGCGLIKNGETTAFKEVKAVYCMVPIDDHRLLIGIEGEFLKIFDKSNKTFSKIEAAIDDLARKQFSRYVFSINNRKGKYYIGTGNGVLVFSLASRKISALTDLNGLPVSFRLKVKKLLWIKNVLYLATDQGCFTWSGNSLQPFFPAAKEKSIDIYDIAANDQGIWLATKNEGLIHLSYSGKEIQRLDRDHGLKTNVVFTLLNTGKTLIAGTDKGLVLIKRDSIRMLGTDDGLHQLEFNHGASFYDTKANVAYMGGLKGYTLLDLNKKWFKDAPSKEIYVGTVTLSTADPGKNIEIYNFPYVQNQNIDLKPWQDYQSISIATPMSYAFKYDLEYKLVGVSNKWERLDEDQKITLLGLAPGDYSLMIRSDNAFMTGKTVKLSIHKEQAFFYQLKYFYILLALLMFCFCFLAYSSRMKKIREESLLRERMKWEAY